MEQSGRFGGKDKKERAEHGSIFLPVNSYHCIVPDTYTELALHWHDEMEVTLIREGVSDYRIGQASLRAEKGDLLIVPPCTLHSAMEIPGERMVSDSLVFHLDYLGASEPDLSASRYLRPLMHGQLRLPCRITCTESGYEEIRDCFMEALGCFLEKPPFYELQLKERLLRVLYLLFLHGGVSGDSRDMPQTESRKQMQSVLRYIGEHYQERITIPELAAVSGFSESHFMNFFRQNAGMTCIRYINHYRIQKAANALAGTAQPVMEIALDSGFDNVSYFNLQFRREFGMTPREFRHAHGGGRV